MTSTVLKPAPLKLTLDQACHAIAVLQEGFEKLGLTEDKIAERMENAGDTGMIGVAASLIGEAVKAAFGDYDFENKRPGPFMLKVVDLLADVMRVPAEDVRTMDLDDVLEYIEGVAELEANARVGKWLGRMISPVTSLISTATEMIQERVLTALYALPSGALVGGTIGSTTKLEVLTENSQMKSEDSNSIEPSTSSSQSVSKPNSETQPTG